MKSYAQWVLRFRLPIIGLMLAITAALAMCAPALHVVFDPATLAPNGHPYVDATKRVQSTFGSKYLMVIAIAPKQGDALQPAVLERVERLTRELERTPGVVGSTIMSLAARQAKAISGDGGILEARPLLESANLDEAQREALRKALRDNPVYLDTVISRDLRTAAVLVELKEHPKGFQAMVEPVKRVAAGIEGDDVRVVLGGNPVYLAQAEKFAERIGLLFPIAVLLIGLLHLEAFRTLQGLVLPLVTALMAVVWGMGFVGLTGRPLDIFNAPAPILILAVAAGHAVQVLKRYYEEYAALVAAGAEPTAQTSREAVVRSMVGIGPVTIIAGTVAALGLLSLTVFDIPTIRTFGVFTGLGILSAVVLEMTFIPAVRSLLKPPSLRQLDRERRLRVWDRILNAVGGLIAEPARRRRTIVAFVAFTALCAACTSLIVVDNSSKTNFSSDLQIQHDDRFLNNALGGTNSLYVMIEGGAEDAIKSQRTLEGIARLQRFADDQPEVGKTLSIVDYIRRMHRAMNGDAPGTDVLPTQTDLVSQYLLMYALSSEPDDFSAFVDYDYRRAKIAILLKTGSNREIRSLVERLEAEAAAAFGPEVQVSFGGDVAQTIALTDIMIESKLLNIAQIAFAIFLISALVFRSLLAGAIVLVPTSVAVLAMFAVMGVTGIPLNIANSLIAAMAAGIGSDYAIYLLFRLREEARTGASPVDAMRRTLATAGKAALYVATAVAGGYGVLALSFGFTVHIWTALFMGIAMLVSVFASLILVPGLAMSLHPRFVFGQAARPLAAAAPAAICVAALAGALAIASPAPVRAEAPTALVIMQRSAESTRVKDSTATATFTLTHRSGASRVRKTTGITRLHENGVDTMRLVRFLSPADVKGTSTLLLEKSAGEDELWIYLPALGKVRRLAAANKRDAFMGTDFSYGDIIGHNPAKWTHRLLGEANIEGEACYMVESAPADAQTRASSGYTKRVSWVSKRHWVTMRSEFWDLNGKPLKRIGAAEVVAVGKAGRHQPMLLTAENLQTGHRTSIRFENFKADQGVDASQFSASRLAP